MTQTVSSHSIATPANGVTAIRIMLAPVLMAAIYFSAPAWWVLLFGFFAMYTDKVDGWLARRYGVSALGTFLDPLADKLMVLGSLGILVLLGWVWWLPVLIITGREVAMSWWRTNLARRGISVPARRSAKYKTWVQSFVVAAAITPGVMANASWVVTALLWASVVITIYSFVQYIRDGKAQMKPHNAL